MTVEFLLSKLDEACTLKGRTVSGREIGRMPGFPSRTQYDKCGGIRKALLAIGRTMEYGTKGNATDRLRRTPLKMRFMILERDNFTCQYCGSTPKEGALLKIDHIFPVSKGGETELNNLNKSCFFCNMGKRDVILESLSKNGKATNGN